MAGLEVLYTSVAGSISYPQDALVCFVHWDIVKNGYRCIGSGDEVSYRRLVNEFHICQLCCVIIRHVMVCESTKPKQLWDDTVH